MIEVIFDHSHNENRNVRTFWFKPVQPVRYTAGQFIELYLPHKDADERGEKRWFTLSSAPTEALISITTRYAGENSSTFKQHLWRLQPGTRLRIMEPMGDFVLPKQQDIPLVFVAGGIGVTPFRSMIQWLTDTGEARSIKVLLAANEPADIVFEDLFRNYGAMVTLIASEAPRGWKGVSGQLSAEKILAVTGNGQNKRIYVSGPEPMVEALEKGLLAHGFAKSQLVFDFFPGYQANLK